MQNFRLVKGIIASISALILWLGGTSVAQAAAHQELPAPPSNTTTLEQISHPQLPQNPNKTPQNQPSTTNGAPHIIYSFSNKPSSFDAIEFPMRPLTDKSNLNGIRLGYYWAYQDDFVSINNNTLYFGLQPSGDQGTFGFNNDGKTALFSVFGEGVSSDPQYNYCQPGADEGAGVSCHIAYDWSVGHDYDFTVTLVGLSPTQAAWEGRVYDYSTKESTLIGKITININKVAGIKSSFPVAFDEYYDWQRHDVEHMPLTTALYFTPTGYYQGKQYPGMISEITIGDKYNTTTTKFYSDLNKYAYITQGTQPTP